MYFDMKIHLNKVNTFTEEFNVGHLQTFHVFINVLSTVLINGLKDIKSLLGHVCGPI